MEIRVELKTTFSNTILNYHLSLNPKLLGNDEFNHITIVTLTLQNITRQTTMSNAFYTHFSNTNKVH